MSKILVDLPRDPSAIATVTRDTSPRWMAPELMKDGKISFESDVWSFSMVILEVATEAEPFQECRQPHQVPGALLSGRTPKRPLKNMWITDSVWSFMKDQCWRMDALLRPDMADVRECLLEAGAIHEAQHPPPTTVEI